MDTIPYENDFGLWLSLEKYKQSQHALWMARAIWNRRVALMAKRDLDNCKPNTPMYSVCKLVYKKWKWAEHKCRQKAKEYE